MFQLWNVLVDFLNQNVWMKSLAKTSQNVFMKSTSVRNSLPFLEARKDTRATFFATAAKSTEDKSWVLSYRQRNLLYGTCTKWNALIFLLSEHPRLVSSNRAALQSPGKNWHMTIFRIFAWKSWQIAHSLQPYTCSIWAHWKKIAFYKQMIL